jgi:hypothetical protein
MFRVSLPPSQPSPTGEGVVVDHFPLGGNKKGGDMINVKVFVI